MTKKYKTTEELNDELCINDLVFLVDVTGHWNSPNKELQGKDNLITEMSDSIKAFKFRLQL
jgi:hypothetical protein